MTVRPIIFAAPMVRALLDGRKSQTRRILGKSGRCNIFEPGAWADEYVLDPGNAEWRACDTPYAPGDLLWVRESFSYADYLAETVWYWADGNIAEFDCSRPKPSIHMPRWASRLTLRVTDVRVQRLQDISEEDAIAEGIYRVDPTPEDLANGCTPDDFVFRAPGTRQGWGRDKADRDSEQWGPDARFAFRLLWNHLHGEDAWTVNPWVAAISFETIRANVDQVTP